MSRPQRPDSGPPFGAANASLTIEMVLPTMVAAGMERVVAAMIGGLAARGHRVGVTCTEHTGMLAPPLQAEGHRVSVVPAPGIRSNIRAHALTSWLSRIAPDIVHVHSGTWLKGARAAREARVPRVVHTMHGLERETWYGAILKRLAARHTDWVVPVSEQLIPHLHRVVGVDPGRMTVIPNGIDVSEYSPLPKAGELHARHGIPLELPVVGIVARLQPIKNHLALIDAFSLLLEYFSAHLVIVGDGPLRPELERRIGEHRIGDQVHFHGTTSSMREVYRDLDLLVLSSDAEGTPMCVLEAMAAGVPVITTAVGGLPSLLEHGACGRLVQPGDPRALSEALLDLLRSPDTRSRYAAAARRRVIEHYSLDAMLDSYERVYRGTAISNIRQPLAAAAGTGARSGARQPSFGGAPA